MLSCTNPGIAPTLSILFVMVTVNSSFYSLTRLLWSQNTLRFYANLFISVLCVRLKALLLFVKGKSICFSFSAFVILSTVTFFKQTHTHTSIQIWFSYIFVKSVCSLPWVQKPVKVLRINLSLLFTFKQKHELSERYDTYVKLHTLVNIPQCLQYCKLCLVHLSSN